jgi:hypothetical protein
MSRIRVEDTLINGSTHVLEKATENTEVDLGNRVSRIQDDMSLFHRALPNECGIIDERDYRQVTL